MSMLTITLPWPPRSLSPNSRHGHWATLARAKRSYRAACARSARLQGVGATHAEQIALSLVFVPPDRRARDLDNCIASMKSGLDGLADVICVDDSRWTLTAMLDREQIGGFVRVEVSPWPV
ncbi:MAG: endonuclease [Rubrivivax sp.]|nr:endonuclease [Rubrivivax sp.]